MEKINFVNNTTPALNATNLNKLQDNVEDAFTTDVVESGNNANGNYIKFVDGTMICYKTANFGSVEFTETWGAFYETQQLELGDFPAAFVGDYPVVNLMPTRSWFLDRGYSKSLTSWGHFWGARPVNTPQVVEVYCIAIGRWK